jgi:predicted RNA-binding Zn-ribbon protein involved in translation (DUF1610 family)
MESLLFRRKYSFFCEDCGYSWKVDGPSFDEEEDELSLTEESVIRAEAGFCPMCGNTNITEL